MTDILSLVRAVEWPVVEAAWFDNLNTPGDWLRHSHHLVGAEEA
jgi:hypothetical protein